VLPRHKPVREARGGLCKKKLARGERVEGAKTALGGRVQNPSCDSGAGGRKDRRKTVSPVSEVRRINFQHLRPFGGERKKNRSGGEGAVLTREYICEGLLISRVLSFKSSRAGETKCGKSKSCTKEVDGTESQTPYGEGKGCNYLQNRNLRRSE